MRQVPGRLLWLGNAGDLWNPSNVIAAGIEAVVELADNEPAVTLPRDLIRCRFPLSDGGENPAWLLRLAVESVAVFLRAGVPVLVCCSAGMSRSVCVAAGGMSLAEGRPFAKSLTEVIGTGPADVSPRLLMQFQQALGAAV
ncbi:protein-tyrosine phosphatase family protein [Zavarzinella formosa]|uniref:dual specificity protein phosphatase family protein n=1 Tax=Zavarzinella formosa TaxID=360055 RepID=UPI0002DC2C5A|nr:dual specificity protein phosphatase family protein [Zavarzinella formosa]